MEDIWDKSINRAQELASKRREAGELLAFYAILLKSQKGIYEYLRSRKGWLPSGSLEQDLSVLRSMMPRLLDAVESSGPAALAEQARSLSKATGANLDQMLIEYWRAPSDMHFFAKAFLQPYARWLAETGAAPADRNLGGGENCCPFCQGKPQLAFLQSKESSSEAGTRDMLCSMCLTAWPFRRVVCANCGEEDPERLAYFHSPEYDYIRVDACDTCKYYIKSIDLTRFGFAVPLVDEIAAVPLDLWARERGYTKIELNLIGV